MLRGDCNKLGCWKLQLQGAGGGMDPMSHWQEDSGRWASRGEAWGAEEADHVVNIVHEEDVM